MILVLPYNTFVYSHYSFITVLSFIVKLRRQTRFVSCIGNEPRCIGAVRSRTPTQFVHSFTGSECQTDPNGMNHETEENNA